MIIKGKKYVLSKGVALYPEKEMEVLREQAQLGWQFIKLNNFGFLEFQKNAPEIKKFSVDFFSGERDELDDYLTIYQEAGWECISNHKKKYFYFKADPCVSSIYSDEESYWLRMRKEWLWMFWRNLLFVPFGLLLYWLAFLTREPHTSVTALYLISRFILFLLGTVFTVMPLSIAINVVYSLVFYRDRRKFFSRPEQFAKRQKVFRDIIILTIIGGIIGIFLSILLQGII
ncbi:DUF2812 domain-containing protein [Enterococcus sp. LJL128]|uniref:DUF2812 domain-containing protein n=1 Tax=Enterococcus sp. LJL51 TaxID=3416656 RepID=UPI003CF7FD65